MKKTFLLSLIVVFLATNAHAHALWIEKGADGKYGVSYGEYAEGVREKTGGKLDDIVGVEAWSVDADGKKTALTPVKKDQQFLLEGASSAIVAQTTKQPVKDMTKYKLGIAKPFFYARFADAVAAQPAPETRLDLLLTGEGTARVFFDGQPLVKEKAVWIAPNGWTKEFKTDEKGDVTLERPWPGLYVLEVTHVLEKPGEFDGKPYEVERHRASLSVEKK